MIEYTVHYYTIGDVVSFGRIVDIPPSTTSFTITPLTNGRTYTITVEAVANGLSGESEERTITLGERNRGLFSISCR